VAVRIRRGFTPAGRPVGEITPLPIGRRLGDLPDLLASLPSLGVDAADFAADVDRAREELGQSRVPDPLQRRQQSKLT
jgi:hypothetical protein